MLAIDTNVVVRFLTGDELEQARRARAVIDSSDVYVATTVLMETEWVLRAAYGFDRGEIVGALRAFCGLPGVRLEAPERAAVALDAAEAGMDFADALHLTAAGDCEAFLTFDRRFERAASGVSGPPVRSP